MSYAAANIKTRLDRFEAAQKGPEREYTALEVSTRLAAIVAIEDGDRDLNPRRRRIRQIVEGARARAALA